MLAEPVVKITGGPDESNHNYVWTIEHNHSAPMVFVRFPHYLADLFAPPEGWRASITHPATEGPKTGECTAVAVDARSGIVRGSPARFKMRLGPYAGISGARRGQGNVLIRFADGMEVVVPAQVPVRESFLDRYVSLIGVGVIAGVVLLVRVARRRRARRAGTA